MPQQYATRTETLFLARRPLLDQRGTVQSYEVVSAPDGDGRAPSVAAIVDELTMGRIDRISGPKPAVIAATPEFLTTPVFTDLAKSELDQIIFEFPAQCLVDADTSLMSSLREARARGVRFALSGATPELFPRQFVPLVEIISFDVMHAPLMASFELAATPTRLGILTAASGVESHEQFTACRGHFNLYRGDFYMRPMQTATSGDGEGAVSTGKFTTMQLLTECANPDATLESFEGIVGRDPGLTFRVMELANSAAAGLVRRIDSLRHAMVMIGINNIRNLAMIASLNGLQDRAPELLRTVLLRAKLSELIAKHVRADHTTAFTAGLLSLLDAFIDLPLDAALARVQLSPELQGAILEHRGRMGEIMMTAIGCEQASFVGIPELVSVDRLASLYIDAIDWVDTLGVPAS
jgi:c-di-GMP phosphodiesterase